MNQDRLKQLLLELKGDVEDFDLIFSGKKSLKVDGLYKPEIRQIIIHNKNTEDENALLYTGIHEFAHHVHFTTSPVPVSRRAHTREFWTILHTLLERAEEKGIYRNKFKTIDEFRQLTNELKENYLVKNGKLMRDFGKLLLKAFNLCRKYDMSFDDYADRELGFGRNEAKKLIRIYNEGINPAVGYHNMETLLRIRDSDKRQTAEKDLMGGRSPDMVKQEFLPSKTSVHNDPVEELRKEKQRIERSIQSLKERLEKVEANLEKLGGTTE